MLRAVFVFHERVPGERHPPSNVQARRAIWRMEERLDGRRGLSICVRGENGCRISPASGYDLATFIAERSAIQFNGGLCPECMDQCFPATENISSQTRSWNPCTVTQRYSVGRRPFAPVPPCTNFEEDFKNAPE